MENEAEVEVDGARGARAATMAGATAMGHGPRQYPEARDLQGAVEVAGEEPGAVAAQAASMCELLRAHMAALDKAGARVAEVAEGLAPPGGAVGAGDLGKLFVDRAARQGLLEGAAAVAAELQAMRSAVRVLAGDLAALGGMAEAAQAAAQGAREAADEEWQGRVEELRDQLRAAQEAQCAADAREGDARGRADAAATEAQSQQVGRSRGGQSAHDWLAPHGQLCPLSGSPARRASAPSYRRRCGG